MKSYAEGERPDMVLAAADNAAQGSVAALEGAGITNMPIITGQDNSPASQALIKSGIPTIYSKITVITKNDL